MWWLVCTGQFLPPTPSNYSLSVACLSVASSIGVIVGVQGQLLPTTPSNEFPTSHYSPGVAWLSPARSSMGVAGGLGWIIITSLAGMNSPRCSVSPGSAALTAYACWYYPALRGSPVLILTNLDTFSSTALLQVSGSGWAFIIVFLIHSYIYIFLRGDF